jgi:heme exporter protein A
VTNVTDNLRLTVSDVAVEYGARRVLAGVSFQVRAGETLVVAGANGSGKSSLLRVICGLQRPARGEVTIEVGNTLLRPMEALQLLGWVAPDLQLYRELTALENLAFFRCCARYSLHPRRPGGVACRTLGWTGAAMTCWRRIRRE